MKTGFKNVAQRLVNAENDFAETLTHFAMISKADAFKALRTMLKLKVAKMDAVNGRISVKNGAYLDHDVICRAIELAD
jgi:hypothetical protein